MAVLYCFLNSEVSPCHALGTKYRCVVCEGFSGMPLNGDRGPHLLLGQSHPQQVFTQQPRPCSVCQHHLGPPLPPSQFCLTQGGSPGWSGGTPPLGTLTVSLPECGGGAGMPTELRSLSSCQWCVRSPKCVPLWACPLNVTHLPLRAVVAFPRVHGPHLAAIAVHVHCSGSLPPNISRSDRDSPRRSSELTGACSLAHLPQIAAAVAPLYSHVPQLPEQRVVGGG